MKNLITLFFTFFLSVGLFAQIQNGTVREINSDKKSLSNVSIIFENAMPTTSNDNGSFRLVFPEKKAGELIFMEEIKKTGYELVNDKAFQILKLSSNDKLGVDIILAKIGVIELAKKEYYEISDRALLAGLEREKKALKQQLEAAKVTENEYLTQLTALQEQYDLQWKLLDELANKFARVNFDDVSEIYQDALVLFKEGKIEAAISKMEKTNLISRIDTRLEERKRILNSGNIIAEQQTKNEQGIREDIDGIQLQAELYTLTYQIDEAEELYDQLLRLDNTDLEILHNSGEFYKTYHRYNKGKYVYTKIIQNPKSELEGIANAYGSIGELSVVTGFLDSALIAVKKSLEYYRMIYEKHPQFIFHKQNLATSYQYLGSIHQQSGILDSALIYFEKFNHLVKELNKSYPLNNEIKGSLALSYQWLGITNTSLGDLTKALAAFEKFNVIGKELCEKDTISSTYKNYLALSYEKLGETHISLGNLDKALILFKKGLEIEKKLYESHPINVNYKNTTVILHQKLGDTYSLLGYFSESLNSFDSSNTLAQEISTQFPLNVEFKNHLASSYEKLGSIYLNLGQINKALNNYTEFSNLEKELLEISPTNLNYKNNLAFSYKQIGSIYMILGTPKKALNFFGKTSELMKELHETQPNNINFKMGLASSHCFLGNAYFMLNDLKMALNEYKLYCQIQEELYKSFSDNVNIKHDLAVAYGKLSITHARLNNLNEVISFSTKSNVLMKELCKEYPDNVQFKNALAFSYFYMGIAYIETDTKQAKEYLKEAEQEFTILIEIFPNNEQNKQILELIRETLKKI
jgi:tetratricopeptide (TPR) repeat protein